MQGREFCAHSTTREARPGQMTRRSLLALGTAAVSLPAILGASASPALAQAWPERPVTVIVPFL